MEPPKATLRTVSRTGAPFIQPRKERPQDHGDPRRYAAALATAAKYQRLPAFGIPRKSRSLIRSRSIRDSSATLSVLCRRLGPLEVMVETNKGITGFGYGGPGAALVIEKHLPKLLLGEDPFQVERLWDIMWRGTLYYGRKGVAVHAISAVDNASGTSSARR